jgi:hypothetical protein
MDNTYLAHFGLVEEPYSTSPNPRYLYISHPQLGPGKDQVDDHQQARAVAGVWTGGDGQDHPGPRAGPVARGKSQRFLCVHHQSQLPYSQSAAASDQSGVRGAAELEELPRPAQHLQKLPNDASAHPAEDLSADHRRGADPESAAARAATSADELREQRPKVFAGGAVCSGGVSRPAAPPEVSQPGQPGGHSSSLENLSYAETVAMLRHRWLVAGDKSFPSPTRRSSRSTPTHRAFRAPR